MQTTDLTDGRNLSTNRIEERESILNFSQSCLTSAWMCVNWAYVITLLARAGFNESVWAHLLLFAWVSLGLRSCQTLQSASFRAFLINYKISHWIKYINNPIWLKVKVMEWANTKNLIKNTHHSINFQEENIYKMRLF